MKKLGIAILGIFIFGTLVIIPIVNADTDSVTKDLVVGINQVSIRDITNTNPQEATLNLDKPIYSLSDNVLITLINRDENLVPNSINSATVTATTPSGFNKIVALTETAVNSNEFTASMSLNGAQGGEELTVSYPISPLGVGRMQVTLDMINPPGKARLSDVILDPNDLINLSFIPVSHAVNLELLDSATLDVTNPPVITISYANLNLGSNDPADLSMYYNPGPFDVLIPINPVLLPLCGTVLPNGVVIDGLPFIGSTVDGGWEEIRDPQLASAASHDPIGKTITSDVANTAFGMNGNSIFGPIFGTNCCPTDAQFLLGFDQGSIGGGGGGGIIFPGSLVLIKTALISIPAVIDIKPNDDSNVINLNGNGVIPIAILTTDDFDATQIEPSSIIAEPGGGTIAHKKGHIEDVNGDGRDDLLIHIGKSSLTLKEDGDITISGTKLGIPFSGSGDVIIKGKKILEN